MLEALPIELDQSVIAAYCARHHIVKLSLFGSVLTQRFGPESDVDVLVEFDRAHVPSLFDVVEMESELSDLLGRKVDLRTPGDLSRFFRDEVVAQARTQYVAAE